MGASGRADAALQRGLLHRGAGGAEPEPALRRAEEPGADRADRRQRQLGWVDATTGGHSGRAGKIRLLGVSGTYRVPGNPEASTLAEQGLGLDQNGWLDLFAAAGTPEPALCAFNAEVNKLMGGEEARQRLAAMNVATFPPNTPEPFAKTMRADLQAWRKIVVENDISA